MSVALVQSLKELGAYATIDALSNMVLRRASAGGSLQSGEIFDFAVADMVWNISGARSYTDDMVKMGGNMADNAVNAVGITVGALLVSMVRGKKLKSTRALEVFVQSYLSLMAVDLAGSGAMSYSG